MKVASKLSKLSIIQEAKYISIKCILLLWFDFFIYHTFYADIIVKRRYYMIL